MDIRVRELVESGHVYCFACGTVYRPAGTIAEAFVDDEQLGIICPSCLAAGSAAIRVRLHRHADVLRAQAATLLQKSYACLHAAEEPIFMPVSEEPVLTEASPPQRRSSTVPVVTLDELDVAV